MFTAMLVDDEQWSLMGLKGSLNWERAGLRIVGESTNSIDALREIERVHPDVVFTDIRMPIVSGIELIEKCREKGIDSEFVLVSGYAEFEYARHALKYGAFDYILKPINEVELNKLASRLVIRLAEKAVTKGTLFDAGDFDLDLVYAAAGIERRYAHYRAGIVAGIDPQAIARALAIEGINFVPLKAGSGKTALLLNCDPDAEEALLHALTRLAEDSEDGSAGLSEASAEADWHKLIEQAFVAEGAVFFDNAVRFRCYSPMNPVAVKAWIDRFFGALSGSKPEEFKDICARLPETFGQVDFGVEALEYFNNSAGSLLRYKYGDRVADAEFETLTFEGLAAKYRNAADYADYVYQICEGSVSGRPKPAASDEAFRKLLAYVDAHYREELYLNDLARDFHISLTYLCEIFRKHTGKNFTKYINDLRLERVRQELKLTDLSIAEIAESAGFKDYFYFSKLFKKNVGVSPSGFRRGG